MLARWKEFVESASVSGTIVEVMSIYRHFYVCSLPAVYYELEKDGYSRELFVTVRTAMKYKFSSFAVLLSGKELPMDTEFLTFCDEELKRLAECNFSDEESLELEQTDSKAAAIVEEISSMMKRGERLNFKLIQELSEKLEVIGERIGGVSSETEDITSKYERQQKQLYLLVLEIFDLLDLVYQTVSDKGETWVSGLEGVIKQGLNKLSDYGLEEINVEGLLFDGQIMEGIGTLPEEQLNGDLAKYAVHTVVQRGFRIRDNGKVIRRARVITVL